MSPTSNDPAGTTQQFQQFARQQQGQPEKTARVNVGLIAGIAAVLALVAIIAIAVMMTM
jgi:type IV secretory pathway component VirB8